MILYHNRTSADIPVAQGDIIPASQTLGQKEVKIVTWNDDLYYIQGLLTGSRELSVFTADELGLVWKTSTEEGSVEILPPVNDKPEELLKAFENRNKNNEHTSKIQEGLQEYFKTKRRLRADAIKSFICKHLIVVLENPTNIMNIGIAMRNVNALGVATVYVIDKNNILPDDWEGIRNHRSLNKISVSASKWSFIKKFKSTQDCIDHLKSINYRSVVTSPHIKDKAHSYLEDTDFTTFHKLAIWFGSETSGISDLAVTHSELCVSIPMFGMIESFNLGTSTGIVLYEITKQRRAYQSKYRRRNKKGKRDVPLPTVMSAP